VHTPGPTQEQRVERKIVSVLFADLVGFTTLSERLDPEDVATVQDAYFARVRETIGRYSGQLEKFIGDAAMAVFGTPRTRDDDAERAVRAGLALTSAVEQLSARVGLDEGDLRLRVGVNTGEVVYAQSGPDEGRVTGDTVNTAARFQTAAAPGGVLIGETTALAVAESIDLQPAGAIGLKGKAEPVRAWHAVGVLPERSRDHAMGELRAPIVGRDEELALLESGLSRVRSGRCERLVVVAPPGVGKTRLVDEFVRRSVGGPTTGLAWRARLRPDVVAPYQPIAQLVLAGLVSAGMDFREGLPGPAGWLIRDALATAGVAEGRAEVVTQHLLSLIAPGHERGRPGAGSPGAPAADRDAIFQAWIEGLDALARGATQLWVVEDVHWAGGDAWCSSTSRGGQPRRPAASCSPPPGPRCLSGCRPGASRMKMAAFRSSTSRPCRPWMPAG
jgi:class 3 adenylate cyclase